MSWYHELLQEFERQISPAGFFKELSRQFSFLRFIFPGLFTFNRRDKNHVEHEKITHAMRVEVYKRYGKRCLYPGCTETQYIEIDHVVSVYNGGRTVIENLQPLCRNHNLWKGRRTIDYRTSS